ncbi:MAG: pectinesterase family protein [Phycisphaerae bacterium]|nr:pectinesterase family protein [Phycisphaerae bacterium]MDW8261280.1 pectinesterase family protein [Phycisphaerales bacterium]
MNQQIEPTFPLRIRRIVVGEAHPRRNGRIGRILAGLLSVVLMATFGHAEEKVIRVCRTGTMDFSSVQQAIDAVPEDNPQRIVIEIQPGTYKERIRVETSKPRITLRGADPDPRNTVLTFDLFAGSVVPPATQPVGTSGSASTTILADDFHAENLTFENTAGQVGQAVALRITGDRGVFRNCRFLGWQDTLCVDGGRQLFERCYIEGRVDFIFGRSTAVFDHCEIRSKQGGYVTAARTPPHAKFGFVFLDCRLIGDDTPAFLGRPWQWDRGSNAAVAFIRCQMGPHIRPDGWNPWHLKDKQNLEPQKVTRFREFGSMDLSGAPLDVSGRVPWSQQLSPTEAAEYTRQNVLAGEDGWKP